MKFISGAERQAPDREPSHVTGSPRSPRVRRRPGRGLRCCLAGSRLLVPSAVPGTRGLVRLRLWVCCPRHGAWGSRERYLLCLCFGVASANPLPSPRASRRGPARSPRPSHCVPARPRGARAPGDVTRPPPHRASGVPLPGPCRGREEAPPPLPAGTVRGATLTGERGHPCAPSLPPGAATPRAAAAQGLPAPGHLGAPRGRDPQTPRPRRRAEPGAGPGRPAEGARGRGAAARSPGPGMSPHTGLFPRT